LDELLTLEDIAGQTGVSVRRLREWCATGRPRCERDGHDWLIPMSELDRVQSFADGGDHPIDGRPVAIVVPADTAPRNVAIEVAKRLGLGPATVAMSNLSIDGQDYVVAAWKDADGAGGLPDLAKLAEEIGGDILEAPAPADERRGRSQG
jgi:hypothetical protein